MLKFTLLWLTGLAFAEESVSNVMPNIVLISVDGLRLDHTHFAGNPNAATPNMDALVQDGVWFPNSWSQSNESLYSHAAIFSGQYATELGPPNYLEYILPEDAVVIPEVLKIMGYDTASFLSGGHIGKGFGFEQGFDVVKEGADFGSFHETTGFAAKWLDSRKESNTPFFMFLHGYDCHRPYKHNSVFHHPFDGSYRGAMEELVAARNKSETTFDRVSYRIPYQRRIFHDAGHKMLDPATYIELKKEAQEGKYKVRYEYNDRDIKHLKAHYDSGVLAADTYLGIFFEKLGQLGLWENTLIILTSDHGEDLQDHGFTNHRAVLMDSTTMVPMVISGGLVPSEMRGKTFSMLTEAIDVFPTIASMVGTMPPASAKGNDLWGVIQTGVEPENKYVFQQGVLGHIAVRTEEYRLVFSGIMPLDPQFKAKLMSAEPDSEYVALYMSSTDTDEVIDIKKTQVERTTEMLNELKKWYASLPQRNERHILSKEQMKVLQEGGYW